MWTSWFCRDDQDDLSRRRCEEAFAFLAIIWKNCSKSNCTLVRRQMTWHRGKDKPWVGERWRWSARSRWCWPADPHTGNLHPCYSLHSSLCHLSLPILITSRYGLEGNHKSGILISWFSMQPRQRPESPEFTKSAAMFAMEILILLSFFMLTSTLHIWSKVLLCLTIGHESLQMQKNKQLF